MDGDQSSLNDHGAWASVKSPMTLMSTPSRAIHAGMASHTRPRGRPEENESSTTEARRQLPATRRIPAAKPPPSPVLTRSPSAGARG